MKESHPIPLQSRQGENQKIKTRENPVAAKEARLKAGKALSWLPA